MRLAYRLSLLGAAAAGFGFTGPAFAGSGLTTIYTFTGGADGGAPTNLIPGPKNTFFGTAEIGGAASSGTVFQLSPPAKGAKSWTVTTLYSFGGGSAGSSPLNLTADGAGNLFGTTLYGGGGDATCPSIGCGTVFELSPPAKGQTLWTETTLHSFTSLTDGYLPWAVTRDAAGNLYGFAYGGTGSCSYNGTVYGCGEVYELSPPAPGQSAWTYSLIYSFAKSTDGDGPSGIPLLDSAGAIYGTTGSGGTGSSKHCLPFTGCSLVFKLTPPAPGHKNWTKTTLFQFDGQNGVGGPTSLSFDAGGNLYGTTNEGGVDDTDCPGSTTYGFPPGCGTAFELSPPVSGSKWVFTPIWSFDNGADGSFPYNTGFTAAAGAYYTATSGGYPLLDTFGSIVQFAPPMSRAGSWTEKTIFTFTADANGGGPICSLLPAGGYLYGTTNGYGIGSAPAGSIFRLKP